MLVTGSGTNMGKMVVNGVRVLTGNGAKVGKMVGKVFFCNRKWCKCLQNGGKICFLQQEVVQMLKKWQKKVIFFNS
jgi:hypothetical protein